MTNCKVTLLFVSEENQNYHILAKRGNHGRGHSFPRGVAHRHRSIHCVSQSLSGARLTILLSRKKISSLFTNQVLRSTGIQRCTRKKKNFAFLSKSYFLFFTSFFFVPFLAYQVVLFLLLLSSKKPEESVTLIRECSDINASLLQFDSRKC